MEISLRTNTAALNTAKTPQNGAASPKSGPILTGSDSTNKTSLPLGLGQIGAVNETRINTLKDGKTPPAGFDRTLKPYDTVMLPYIADDEKQVHRTA